MAEVAGAVLTGAALEDFAGAVDGQSATRAQLTATATAAAAAAWAEFEGWYDTTAIGELTRGQRLQLTAAKRQAASLTNGYLTRTIADVTGGRRRPASRLVDVEAVRTDPFTGGPMSPATLQHVYGRPADQYRYARAQRALELSRMLAQRQLDELGEERLAELRQRYTVEQLRNTRELEFDDTEFRQLALERAEHIVHDELTLAMRHQARRTMGEDSRVQGYRRIIRPDLSSVTGVCGLCIAASDRRYYVAELQPVHTGCNCEVAPIVGGRDPGRDLNAADLGALYEAAGSTGQLDLLRVRVKVTEHGELGPVLSAFNTDPKLAPQVRRQQNRQRRPDAGGAPDAEE